MTTSPRHNLPSRLASFVGREREIAEVAALVGVRRLVTLVGPPGVGKTRLGLQVGTAVLGAFTDGVWLVELAPLAAPELVPRALADVLGVHEQPGRSLIETLAGAVRDRCLLLILDNCEHLVEASATLSDALLRACPGLHVLATSREPLSIDGEVIHHVPPLAVPDADSLSGGTLPGERLGAFDGVRLLVERAQAADASFALTDASAVTVGKICARLDGIPLALELAAARVRAFSVEQIAERLEDRFRLLTGGNRAALPRLQTLGGAVDWSYALLAEPERALLRRLAVFAGGFTLDTVEGDSFWTVGAEADAMTHPAAADVLFSLIEKSLVQVEERAPGERRYRLLEMIRQYGLAKLAEHGELSATRDRHRDFFVRFAEEHGPGVDKSGYAARLRLLDAEHDNLRAALGWCLERARADRKGLSGGPDGPAMVAGELGLRLAAALYRYWNIHVHQREGRRWLEQLLALPIAADTPARAAVRADALHGAAMMVAHHGEYWAAVPLLEEAADLFRIAGDDASRTAVLGRVAVYLGNSGEFDLAVSVRDEALAIARRAGNPEVLRRALFGAASVSFAVGELTAAASFGEECVALGRALGSGAVLSYALQVQCRALLALGDLDRAQALADESFRMADGAGNTRGVADAHRDLGHVAIVRGDPALALGHYQTGLAIVHGVGDRSGIAMCLRGVARASMRLAASARADASTSARHSRARSRTETEQLLGAVRLLSTALATIDSLRYALARTHKREIDEDLATLHATLGEASFSEAWDNGRAMPLDHAVEYARNVTPPSVLANQAGTSAPARSYGPAANPVLSRREEQVAALVAEGLSNPQIAERLDLSSRTIDAHLRNILGKLDVGSRAQVAAWAVVRGLGGGPDA